MPIRAMLNASVTGRGTHVLVLGNGVGTNQDSWRHVAAAFAHCCRIVRFDHVGTPNSDVSAFSHERYTSLYPFADDLSALLEELDVRDATYVGHSASAMLGAMAAIAAPERIGHLVMVGASPRYIDEPAAGYTGGFTREAVEQILKLVATDFHAWAGGFSPLVLGPAAAAANVEEFCSYLRAGRPDIAHRTLTAIFTGDYRAALPHVPVPVTVFQPQDDPVVPRAVGEYIVAHVPRGTLRVAAMHGHVPQLTHPELLIDAVADVLAARGVDVGHPEGRRVA